MISKENEMRPIKAFFDTNVIIDAITKRDNNFKDSSTLIREILKGKIIGYICSKQITDIYYILRKYISNEEQRLKYINTIIKTFKIFPLMQGDLLAAYNTKIKDYEDAILDEVAKVNMIPYLISNNSMDYANSKTVVLTPNQFLSLFQL